MIEPVLLEAAFYIALLFASPLLGWGVYKVSCVFFGWLDERLYSLIDRDATTKDQKIKAVTQMEFNSGAPMPKVKPPRVSND